MRFKRTSRQHPYSSKNNCISTHRMGNKTLKRQQHVNWSAHAQTCCGDINKPACVPDRSRQMNNTHRAALAHCLPKKPDDQTLACCPAGQQQKNQKIMLHEALRIQQAHKRCFNCSAMWINSSLLLALLRVGSFRFLGCIKSLH